MLILNPAGLLALDDDKHVIEFKRFRDQADTVAEKIRAITERGEIVDEIREIIQSLSNRGIKNIVVDNERFADVLRKVAGDFSIVSLELKLDIEKVLSENNIIPISEYRRIVHEVSNAITRSRIREAVEKRDIHIVHAVRALDDVEKHLNQIYTRVREWYGVHFPELEKLLQEPVSYLKFVAEITERDKINTDSVSKILSGKDMIEEIVNASRNSLGAPLSGKDAEMIRSLAKQGLRIADMKEKISDYIKTLMATEAPNVSAVAGPVLGSRLISLAGGLEKLAKMPASTIQVLGAEKALFRFLRTGRGAPKHGVIFQHPYIHTSPRWQRGKIARALATKISIAAKIDYFTKEDRGSELKQALDQRIEEIKRKYPKPPRKPKEKVIKPPKRRRR